MERRPYFSLPFLAILQGCDLKDLVEHAYCYSQKQVEASKLQNIHDEVEPIEEVPTSPIQSDRRFHEGDEIEGEEDER